jgi:adenosine/AMP kinase
VAFCEASGPCLVRYAGNDGSPELATEAETDIEGRKQFLKIIGYKI